MISSTVRYPFYILLICATATIFAPGCRGPLMLNYKSVHHIDLMTQPVAANLDGAPGADGLQIKIYLYHKDKTIFGGGTLNVMLFDGNDSQGDLRNGKPIHTWTFSPNQLKPFLANSYGLLHYQLTLAWGENKPRSKTVTILARYTENDGKEIFSTPVIVPVMLE